MGTGSLSSKVLQRFPATETDEWPGQSAGSAAYRRTSFEPYTLVWLGGVVVGRRISDREVASSIPGCSAARCNSGQVVHTQNVPLFTKQYHKLVPASAGVKCTTGAVLGMLAAIRRTLWLAANRRHSSIVLSCGCRCTAALK